MPAALSVKWDRQIGTIQKHFSLYLIYYRRTECNKCLSSVFIYFWRDLAFLPRKVYSTYTLKCVRVGTSVCDTEGTAGFVVRQQLVSS